MAHGAMPCVFLIGDRLEGTEFLWWCWHWVYGYLSVGDRQGVAGLEDEVRRGQHGKRHNEGFVVSWAKG